MDPVTAGLITGGAGLIGSLFSSQTSASNTQAQIAAQEQMLGQTENFNAQQSQIQRDYETQMSNTAYQRASSDMTKAGLNPMMMFGSGGPSSTPAVGSASVGTPSVPMPQKTSPLGDLGKTVSSALTAAVQAKEMDKLTEQTANVDLQNKDLSRQLALDRPGVDVNRTQADTGATMARTTLTEQLTHMNIPEEQKAAIWSALPDGIKKGQVWSDVAGDYGRGIGNAVSPVTNAIGTLTSSALKRRGMDLLEKRNDLNASQFEEKYGYRPSDRY